MKKLLSVFLIILLIFTLSACGDKEETASTSSEDIDYTELYEKPYNPYTYVYESYVSTDSSGKKDEKIYRYDDAGNLIYEMVKYDFSDEAEIVEYEYDSNNRRIRKKSYSDSILKSDITYEYNERGDIIFETHVSYNSNTGEYDHTLYYKIDYEYNENGYITRIVQTHPEKDKERYVEKVVSEITYDENNRPVAVTEEIIHSDKYLESRPNLTKSSKTTVYYNEKLEKIKVVIYNEDGTTRISQETLPVEDGKEITEFYYEDGSLRQINVREFYTNGLEKKSLRYDADNNLLAERSYKYNKYGDITEHYENFPRTESTLYKYDDYGNCIHYERTSNGGLPRKITYELELNENGNILTSTSNTGTVAEYSGWKAFEYPVNEKESPFNPESTSVIRGLVVHGLL